MTDLNKKKESLCDRIWKTRKARIEAERRIILTKLFWQNSLFIYSLYGVVLSIFFLDNGKYSITILCISVAITMLSLFIRISDFDKKIIEAKDCYTKLMVLKCEAEQISKDSDLIAFEEKYASILLKFDNHLDSDYRRAQYNFDENKKENRGFINWFSYYYFYIWYYFLIYIIFIGIPIFLITILMH